jgi:hypothetical protein
MHALSSLVLQRIGSLRADVVDAVRFATGMTIVGGGFVIVQTLLLAEHVCTLVGGLAPVADRGDLESTA